MERKYAIRKNHLEGQVEVHPRMRTVLLDWISEVHTQYHFAQETFHLAVSLIDRYLQVIDLFHSIFSIQTCFNPTFQLFIKLHSKKIHS